MPMIATTIINSISVKPLCICLMAAPERERRPRACAAPLDFNSANYGRQDAGRYFGARLPLVQLHCLASLDVRISVPSVMALLTPVFFILASTLMVPTVVTAPPRVIVQTYLPARLPITSPACAGQEPLSLKYSANGVLPPAVRLTASDTCERAM